LIRSQVQKLVSLAVWTCLLPVRNGNGNEAEYKVEMCINMGALGMMPCCEMYCSVAMPTQGRREEEFSKHPRLKKYWNHLQKKDGKMDEEAKER